MIFFIGGFDKAQSDRLYNDISTNYKLTVRELEWIKKIIELNFDPNTKCDAISAVNLLLEWDNLVSAADSAPLQQEPTVVDVSVPQQPTNQCKRVQLVTRPYK